MIFEQLESTVTFVGCIHWSWNFTNRQISVFWIDSPSFRSWGHQEKKAERSERNFLEPTFNNNKTFCARRRRAFFFVLRRVDAIRNDSIGLIVFGEGVQFHVRTPIVQKPDFPVWCVLTDQNLSKRTKPTKIYQHPTPPSRFGVLTWTWTPRKPGASQTPGCGP